MQRLKLNVGRKLGISPGDVVGKILGLTKLPPNIVGAIALFDDYLFVDVAEQHASLVMTKLSKVDMKGCRLQVELAESRNLPAQGFGKREDRKSKNQNARRDFHHKRKDHKPSHR